MLWRSRARTALQFCRRMYCTVPSKAVADMAARDGELRVFVVAGEVSGDTIGSRLMSSLKKLSPFPLRFAGVGGSMMSNQGLKSIFPMEDISVMGIWELLPHLGKMRMKLKETIDAAVLFHPHVVVTVDSKGFSFRLLKQLRSRYGHWSVDAPIHFHYVAPSFWAWKGGEARLGNLAKFVDHIFCILPNEAEVCKLNGLNASFVGHPILEDALELNQGKDDLQQWKLQGNCESFRHEFSVPKGATTITLLPGSRLQEVSRMLPIFKKTIKLLKESFPDLLTVIHVAPNQDVKNYTDEVAQKWPVPLILIPGGKTQLKYDAFSASEVALCTSGTVAIEMQLARLPCVVAYRAHFLTEWLIRYKAKIPYISLPNILMNSPIIPEALFQACTPSNLALLVSELVRDQDAREKQILSAEDVMKLLWPSKLIYDESSSAQDDRTKNCCWYSPSMIAASTILDYVKP